MPAGGIEQEKTPTASDGTRTGADTHVVGDIAEVYTALSDLHQKFWA